jgi:hypothetical protein
VLIDVYSPPRQVDGPVSELPMRDMKRIDASRFREEDAGHEPPAEQPQRSTKRHWEIEYAVPEDGMDRKDFELSG